MTGIAPKVKHVFSGAKGERNEAWPAIAAILRKASKKVGGFCLLLFKKVST